MEKQNTKIIKDQKQTRTTIPAKLVKEAGVETGHVAEWELKDGRLSADVMSHDEFVKEVAEKTMPLQVPEESEQAMSEDYEWDPETKGPRSRPEYERKKELSNHSPISSEEEHGLVACRSDTDTLYSGDDLKNDAQMEKAE